jgi:hypothetical protein
MAPKRNSPSAVIARERAPDDRLRDEAIHFSTAQFWIASLRSQ